jgi:hypothetical protein
MTVLPRFWQPSAFEHAVSGESALLGLYYGALLTVTFLNLIGFAINRQSIYLTYSGYVSVIGVHLLAVDGLLAQFVLPDHPLIANQMLGATLGLGTMFGFRFYAQVLRLPGRFPWSDRVIWGMALLGGATGIAAFTPYYPSLAPLLLLAMIVSLPVFLRPLISMWRNRDAESRMTALAYSQRSGGHQSQRQTAIYPRHHRGGRLWRGPATGPHSRPRRAIFRQFGTSGPDPGGQSRSRLRGASCNRAWR